MSKKRVWGWLIATLLLVTGGSLYSYWPHLSNLLPQRKMAVQAATTQEASLDSQEVLAAKTSTRSKLPAGILIGLVVGGIIFIAVRTRNKRRSARNNAEVEPDLGTTVPAPSPPIPDSSAKKKGSDKGNKCWWNPNLDGVVKTIWPPLSLALVVFLLAIGVVVARPDWHANVEAWSGDPQAWGITLLALALLVLAIRSKFYTALGWLFTLILVSLIAFLLIDTFGADAKKVWDANWRSQATANTAPSSNVANDNTVVNVNVSSAVTNGRMQKVITAPPVGKWSQETFSVPRGVDFTIKASKEVRVRCKWRPERSSIIGPTQSPDFGRNLKIIESTFEFQSTSMCPVQVTCEWETKE